MTLKITSLEVFPLSIPLSKPMYMANRCLTHAETLVVKIEADGLVGWGEAAAAPRMTGDTLPGMVQVVNRYLKPIILGKSVDDYKELSEQIISSVYANTGAKSAINSALLDLASRYNSLQMNQLLGSKIRDSFKSMRILGNKTPEEDIQEAADLFNTGVDFFKIKIGKNTLAEEIEQTYRIRQSIGNSILCVDANNGLSTEFLNEYVTAVEDANLIFLEQPFSEIVPLNINIPICMDESVFNEHDILYIKQSNAGQGINLKTIKLSGPLRLVKAAQLANSIGLKVNLSAKVAETGIATNALLNCAAVVPNIDWGLSTTNQYLVQDIIKAPKTNVLEAVEVDEYLIRQFTYSDVY